MIEVFGAQEANTAIQKDGWKLLAITSATSPQAPTFITICYVLGKRKPVSESSIN
ncbi:hypothetical protein IMF27_24995 [Pseudomonas sp. PCH199]|uniref:hypothetical protein n=1 Tax=unclassified Pseudomonas TaxID=196821 RepID=UPI0015A81195|nr:MULTISPECIES: hypothetical protein [unclassified Pseudomonas]MCW8278414.1 hypothetical protein [Pseudomonas sp. PCH199]